MAEFDRPPVREVAISVRFTSPDVTVVDLVRWADRNFRDDYPNTEIQPPVDMPIETFGGFAASGLQLRFTGSPLTRLWYAAEDGNRLIQLQPGWLAVNWRDAGTGATYPRFSSVEAEFARVLRVFEDEFGSIAADQVEVTYVNEITRSAGEWTSHGELGQVLVLVGASVLGSEPLEQIQVKASTVLGSVDRPLGRLHIEATPALSARTREPVFLVNLTARGAAASPSTTDVLEFVATGHRAIVQGFVSATTARARAYCGQHD